MYNIPQGKITFKDVEDFCKEEHEEDLILDYKSDWPKELDRILCGMANVQGGMVLVGVGTQPGTRKPAWPPPGVEGTDDGLRQKVIQIAYDSVYPPVFPQIDVVPLDTDPSRVVVVIRVDASRLLHAIDQRRRVYVRIFDHSRGVQNDLASLSQLEWLFQQRQKSIELRHFVVARAAERASKRFTTVQNTNPIVAVHAVPVFPHQRMYKTPPDVRQVAIAVSRVKSTSSAPGRFVPSQTMWRTTSEGAFSMPRLREEAPQYMEVSQHGLIYLGQVIRTRSGTDPNTGQPIRLLGAFDVLVFCEAFLGFAVEFYSQFQWRGPVQVAASLKNVQDIALDHRHPSHWIDPPYDLSPSAFSQDATVTLVDEEYPSHDLAAANKDILKSVTYNLMWAFGFPDTHSELDGYVAGLLQWPTA